MSLWEFSNNFYFLMKGTYVLILNCIKNCRIKVGKLGYITFKKGYYFYVGSAFNNLEKRIERHFRKFKKKKWHIDYLTTNKNFKIIDVVYILNKKVETELVKHFEKLYEYVKGFGSSDTKNKSHLFYSKELKLSLPYNYCRFSR